MDSLIQLTPIKTSGMSRSDDDDERERESERDRGSEREIEREREREEGNSGGEVILDRSESSTSD